MMLRQLEVRMEKKKTKQGSYVTSSTKIHSKQIKDLNVRAEAIKRLYENRYNFASLTVAMDS